jgi:hypothetical protein
MSDLPPPPPQRASAAEIGDAMEKTGCAITKLVLLGAVFIVGLLIVIGLVVGDTDPIIIEDPDAAPTTTEAATDAAPTTTETTAPETAGDLDPAVVAVLDVFGRCLQSAGVNIDRAESFGPPSTLPGQTGADVRWVTFEAPDDLGPVVFDAQLTRGDFLPGTATLPIVSARSAGADAALNLGEANDPDCY